MAGGQMTDEERQRRIEEAKKRAAEAKAAREAAAKGSAPSPAPATPLAPSPGTAATPPALRADEEQQRRIEEAKRKAEEARTAREAGGAGGQATQVVVPPQVPAAPAPPPRPAATVAPRPAATAAAPPTPPRTIPLALKEWAVVVKALEQGKQIILFRKGGLAEREFKILEKEFLLFPTYEHQDEKMIKPAYKGLLQEVGGARPDGTRVAVTTWARLHEAIPVRNLDKLVQLEDYHIFARAYAEERHTYKPYLPTNVLFLRTYILPQALAVDLTPEQAGCKSWVDVDIKVPWEGSHPALSDDEFRRRHQEIRTIIT